jgi:hypothetical protein
MSNYHEMMGYPYANAVEAAEAATAQAKQHIEEDTVIVLAYGGPMAPWAGKQADKLRSLGIYTLATGLCVVSDYNDIYTEVYEIITQYQKVSWLHDTPRKDLVVAHARTSTSQVFNKWLKEYKDYNEF